MKTAEIRTIAEQHPESVALVFNAFCIQAEPTARNLSNAITIFKTPFLQALKAQIEAPVSNLIGPTVKSIAPGDLPQKPKTFIETIVEGIRSVSGAITTIKGTNQVNNYPDPDEESNRILGINKTLFFILSAVLIVVLILVIRKK